MRGRRSAGRTASSPSGCWRNTGSSSEKLERLQLPAVMKILTLVVTFNQAPNIRRLVTEILTHVPTSDVLVVDDNSPDATGEVVRAMQAEGVRVQLLIRTS